MRQEELLGIGQRLTRIRGHVSQIQISELLGVHKNTVGTYERGEREIGALALLRLAGEGWNINWLLTGEGAERLDAPQATPARPSPAMRPAELTMAVQLAEEALDGGHLEPADYAELVTLVYGALVSGLPNAQVIAFARPAARGLSSARSLESGKSTVGGKG